MITVKSHWRFSKWWLTKSHSSIFLDHPKTKKSIHSWETFNYVVKKTLINLICKQIYTWSTFKNQYVLMKFCEYIDAFKWHKKNQIFDKNFWIQNKKFLKVTIRVHFHRSCESCFPVSFEKIWSQIVDLHRSLKVNCDHYRKCKIIFLDWSIYIYLLTLFLFFLRRETVFSFLCI